MRTWWILLCAGCSPGEPPGSDAPETPPVGAVEDTAPAQDTAEPSGTPFVTPTGARYALVFSGGGYQALAGKPLYLRLGWLEAPHVDAWKGSLQIPSNGAFSEVFDDALVEGGTYVLHWYIDLDLDGRCSPPPADLVWSTEDAGTYGGLSVPIGPVDDHVTLQVAMNNWYDFDGCDVL